jgi:hypothetical protein
MIRSTCFGHFCAHHQELTTISLFNTWNVWFFGFDGWCLGVGWLAMWLGWRQKPSAQSHSRFTPGKETRNPLYRRLGGHKGRFGLVRITSLPLGFDYQTVQPVASRYTDCAIPAHKQHNSVQYISHFLPRKWKRNHVDFCMSVSIPSRMRRVVYKSNNHKKIILYSRSDFKCVN